MNEQAQSICDEYSDMKKGCEMLCPLRDVCKRQWPGGFPEWAGEVNKAAERVGG
jgi:hypothetical protein